MRRFPVAVGGALLVLVLSGCGNEAGPTPKQGGEPGPDALPTKLDALTVDQCYASPRTQLPKGCEKYVTEVGNVPGAARKRANDRDPRLVAEADKLQTAVGEFRGAGCTTVPDAGGPCTQALVDIAAALSGLKKQVDAEPTTS
ncbi:hypothetical protein [Amycolatopsis australiensis]|uniref:Secreted protein n=1 Tax=Amycolatopsis australiensis TaxID=546364 RepID=A0A1K1P533_9PSEU|nr:hypothetical protein [Amycolatopsis australiensis]SFW42587.1 hypothetical protein SAMN04489730_0238 [Amycolatopsis australiensis]